jgi:hypothetical protein
MTSTINWASNGGNTVNNTTTNMGLPNGLAYGQAAIPTGTAGRPYGVFDSFDWQRMAGPSGVQPSAYPLPYTTEHNIIPQLWSGDSVTHAAVFVTVLSQQQLFPVKELLPFRKWDGPLKIKWNEWHFEPAELDIVPDEGNVRLLQHYKQGSSMTFRRWGRGFSMNREYMNTQEGMIEFSMKLIQLSQSVMQTTCLDAINAIKAIEPKSMETGPESQLMDLDRYHHALLEDRNWFGIVQKTEYGMELLVNEIQSTLDARMQPRDGRVLYGCSALELYTKYRPENQFSHLSSNKPSDMSTLGVRFVPSQPYNSEGSTAPVDPMWEESVVGEVNLASDVCIKDVKGKDYHSAMRDIQILSTDIDDYAHISLQAMWKNCGAVDWNNPFQIPHPHHAAADALPYVGGHPGRGRHRFDNGMALADAPDGGSVPNPYMTAYPLTPLGEEIFGRYKNIYNMLVENKCLKQTIEKINTDPRLKLALYRKLQVNLSRSGKDNDDTVWKALLKKHKIGANEPQNNPCCPSEDFAEYYLGTGLLDGTGRDTRVAKKGTGVNGPWGDDLVHLFKLLDDVQANVPGFKLPAPAGAIKPGKDTLRTLLRGRAALSPVPPPALVSPRAPVPPPASVSPRAPVRDISAVADHFSRKGLLGKIPVVTTSDGQEICNYLTSTTDQRKVSKVYCGAFVYYIAKLKLTHSAAVLSVMARQHSLGAASTATEVHFITFAPVSALIDRTTGSYTVFPFTAVKINLVLTADEANTAKSEMDSIALMVNKMNTAVTEAMKLAAGNTSTHADAVDHIKTASETAIQQVRKALTLTVYLRTNPAFSQIVNWYVSICDAWLGRFSNNSTTDRDQWNSQTYTFVYGPLNGLGLPLTSSSLTTTGVADFRVLGDALTNEFTRELEGKPVGQTQGVPERQWHTQKIVAGTLAGTGAAKKNQDTLIKALDNIITQCSEHKDLAEFCASYREELEDFAAYLSAKCTNMQLQGLTTAVFRSWILVMQLLYERVKDNTEAMHTWTTAVTHVNSAHYLAVWPLEVLLSNGINAFGQISYETASQVIGMLHKQLINALHETQKEHSQALLESGRTFGDEKEDLPELVNVLQRTEIRDSRYFDFCIQHDIWFPMSFLLFRNSRVRTGVVIAALTGGRLGNTFIGKCDMDSGSNMHQKTIQWNLTLWMKSHVLNDKAAVVHRSVIVKGVLGGHGHTFYQYTDEVRNDYREGRMHPREADIFCCLVPLDYRLPKEYIHLCGVPDPNKVMYSDLAYGLDYPTAVPYRNYWGWKYVSTERSTSNLPHASNMVMWQGHSKHFKHTGRGQGTYDNFVICKSPYGDRVYPGCAKIREGHGFCYKQPAYLGNTSVQVGV